MNDSSKDEKTVNLSAASKILRRCTFAASKIPTSMEYEARLKRLDLDETLSARSLSGKLQRQENVICFPASVKSSFFSSSSTFFATAFFSSPTPFSTRKPCSKGIRLVVLFASLKHLEDIEASHSNPLLSGNDWDCAARSTFYPFHHGQSLLFGPDKMNSVRSFIALAINPFYILAFSTFPRYKNLWTSVIDWFRFPNQKSSDFNRTSSTGREQPSKTVQSDSPRRSEPTTSDKETFGNEFFKTFARECRSRMGKVLVFSIRDDIEHRQYSSTKRRNRNRG